MMIMPRDGSAYASPQRLTRDQVDVSAVRKHCREEHAHAAARGLPRSNADVSAWHARQHHRYVSALAHVHRGPWTLIVRAGNMRGTGQVPRPLGWFTGRDAVTREQQRAEWAARRAAELGPTGTGPPPRTTATAAPPPARTPGPRR